MHRDNTKVISIGNIKIGGGSDIAIQSMTNTKTTDIRSTISQIEELKNAGCDIVRISIPDNESADAIEKIKDKVNIPIVADIHFDYKLAVKAIQKGADKIRINPGNIGSKRRIAEIVKAAKERNIPIRVGVNSGSIEKDLVKDNLLTCEEKLVESAIRNVQIIESFDYKNIVISIKSSNVRESINAYEQLAKKTFYPLHVGITEAGTLKGGTINSCVGIGSILSRGIGDTLRVSLSADPVREVMLARDILNSLELRKDKIRIISCPTCSRTKIDIISLASKIEEETKNIKKNIKVAVMGCVVNGPGEASECDIGIAGGDKKAVLFKKGKKIRIIQESEILEELLKEIEKIK